LWIATKSGTRANHDKDQRLNSGKPNTKRMPDKPARIYFQIFLSRFNSSPYIVTFDVE